MAEGGAGLDALLTAKVAIPRERSGFISRTAQRGRLAWLDDGVALVTAPSGYGKTALLAEWARGEERLPIWVSLDHRDDDPAQLLSLVAQASAPLAPLDPLVMEELSAPGASVLGRGVPLVAGHLASLGEPVALFLDDLHEVTSQGCIDVLDLLVDLLPPGSAVAVASQAAVPLDLSHRRVMEVGAADLALDETEGWLLLRWAGVDARPEDVGALVRRTEGWPAGLYLAALALRTTSDDPALPSRLRGSGRLVAADLLAASMDQLSEDERRFLRRTAILNELSGSLCDEVTGVPGSIEHLRSMEQANLLLVPLDGGREWYRYHGLFRELLLAELFQHEPVVLPDLHRRAADWYAEHGRDDLALEQARAGGDTRRAAELTARATFAACSQGHLVTAARWLDALAPRAIARLPSVAVQAAWGHAMSGRAVEASRWAELAQEGTFDGPPPDGAASLESARAMLRAAMLPEGTEAARGDAELAVAQDPPRSPWRPAALTGLLVTQQLSGATAAAEATLAHLVEATEVPLHAALPYACTERARLAITRGDWGTAMGDLERAERAISHLGLHEHVCSGLTYAVRAHVALHADDHASAAADHAHALRLRVLATWALPALAVRLRLELGRFSLALADRSAAQTVLDEIDRIVARRPGLGTLLAEVDALRAQIGGASGRGVGPSSLTPAELRLLPYLQTRLTLPEIGSRLLLSPDTVAARTKAIYRKLAVPSRADAVDRARDLDLLASRPVPGSRERPGRSV